MRLHSVKLVVYLLDTTKGSVALFAAIAANALAITLQRLDFIGQGSAELIDTGSTQIHPVVVWHDDTYLSMSPLCRGSTISTTR